MARRPRSEAEAQASTANEAAPEPEPASCSHRLAGLEPDNFLAFLALLGLLRALDTARPTWKARAHWDAATHPLRPVLTLGQHETAAAVVTAAAEGGEAWGKSLRGLFAKTEADQDPEKVAELVSDVKEIPSIYAKLSTMERLWLACLAGTALEWDKRGRPSGFKSTCGPMKFTSGQMAYAGAIYALVAPQSDRSDQVQKIRKALFSDWTYADAGDTLRYAPSEARRYALQGADPTENTAYRKKGAHTERGASILAALGLLSMTTITTRDGCQVQGFLAGALGAFAWPIWAIPARLRSLEAILAQASPVLRNHSPWLPGIDTFMVAERTRVTDQGDYYNVALAVPRRKQI